MQEHTLFSDPELNDAVLARYLCGEADAMERQWVEQRVRVSERARQELDEARVAWLASGMTPISGDVEKFLKGLHVARRQGVRQQGGSYALGGLSERWSVLRGRGVKGFNKQPLRYRAWYLAASFAVGVVGFVFGWSGHTRHRDLPTRSGMSAYVTANGERANITLPDGSTVMLGVASRLNVPADYASGHHTVSLTGEAVFNVSRHGQSPFTVVAGSTTARVLGTSFAVRHYTTDTTVTVAVREGKVAVNDQVVAASRFIAVGPRGMTHVGSGDASQFGFATGVLTIDSMPLSRAIVELDRWYAADIRLGDASLARAPIVGKFTAGSLSDLTEYLQFLLDARVVRDGHIITLYPKAK